MRCGKGRWETSEVEPGYRPFALNSSINRASGRVSTPLGCGNARVPP